MQGIALKYSYTARSSCLRQADLTHRRALCRF